MKENKKKRVIRRKRFLQNKQKIRMVTKIINSNHTIKINSIANF